MRILSAWYTPRRLWGLLLAVGLVAGLVFWLRDPASRRVEWSRGGLAMAREIRLVREQGEFLLRRESDGWRAMLPSGAVPLRADGARVKSFLDFLRDHPPVRRDLPPVAGEAATILDIRGETSFRLAVVAQSPEGILARLGAVGRHEATEGVLLEKEYAAFLARPSSHYFDLAVLPRSTEDIRRVRVERPGGESWDVVRRQGGFVFQAPETLANQPASTREVEFYAHSVGGLKALRLLPAQVVGEVPPPAALQVSIWRGSDDAAQVLRILPQAPGASQVLATSPWQPTLFALDQERLALVDKTAFAMRERRVVDLNPGQIRAMRLQGLEGSPRSLALSRQEGAWEDAAGRDRVGFDLLLWRLATVPFAGEPVQEAPGRGATLLVWEVVGDKGAHRRFEFRADPGLPPGQVWLVEPTLGRAAPVAGDLCRDVLEMLPLAG